MTSTAAATGNGNEPIARRRAGASLLHAALRYAGCRGIPVFPVWGVTEDGRCRCGEADCENPGKHPIGRLVPHGFKDATTDAATIRRWWRRYPDANIGAPTGKVSGLVVLDADGGDGLTALKALGTPATTWLSKTGRGWQQFFAHPGGGVVIGNRAGLRPDLDVRGDGGYVIAPPSRHASGRRYEYLTSPDWMALAPIPDDVLKLLVEPTNGNGFSYRSPRDIPEGRRNDTLWRVARSLVAKGLSAAAVKAAISEENRARCRPPLPEAEVEALAEHAVTQPDRTGFTPATAVPVNGSGDGLGLVSLGELLCEPAEEHPWVVEPLLPAGGIAMLAGKPKTGKTTTARCLALRVARGEPWLGFGTTKGPVIYLALEEKRAEVREHFRALGAAADDPVYVLCAAAPADALARLRREAERLRPALVIVDPLFRFVRVRAEHGNDYAAMTAALEPLVTFARETGACVLVVHHLGKGERSDTDAILGSTAIFAAVDTALLLKRTERYRTLSSVQRYGSDLDEITLAMHPVTRDVTAGPPRVEADARDAERRILDVVAAADAPVTEAELDAVIEGRRQVWKRALRALVETGRLARVGRGGRGEPFRYLVPILYPGTREPVNGSRPQVPGGTGDASGSRVPTRPLGSRRSREPQSGAPDRPVPRRQR